MLGKMIAVQESGALKKSHCTTDRMRGEKKEKKLWNMIVSSSALSSAQEAVTAAISHPVFDGPLAAPTLQYFDVPTAIALQISSLVPKALVCFQPSCGN